jgi:hypothetical protein
MGAPIWQTWGGSSFLRTFDRRVIFFYQEKFYVKLKRLVKGGSRIGQHSIGAPAGEQGGGSFTRTFGETAERGLWKQRNFY